MDVYISELKVVSWGNTREDAIANAEAQLHDFHYQHDNGQAIDMQLKAIANHVEINHLARIVKGLQDADLGWEKAQKVVYAYIEETDMPLSVKQTTNTWYWLREVWPAIEEAVEMLRRGEVFGEQPALKEADPDR